MIELRQESLASLGEHAEIPISFTVRSILNISTSADGDFAIVEQSVAAPYIKDYDAIDSPAQWPTRFDMANWGLIAAYGDDRRVGGAVIAFDTRAIDLLGDRDDLALLWDIRVRPDYRHQGIGAALIGEVERWASVRGCRELKVETQNINSGACRFYTRRGFTLCAANRGVYHAFPDEVQLLWLKELSKRAAG